MELRLLARADRSPCDECIAVAHIVLRAAKHAGPHEEGEWRLCVSCLGRKLIHWRSDV